VYYVTFVKKFPKVQQITGSGLAFATVLTRALVLICAVGLAACAQLQPRTDLPIVTALPPGAGSNLDTLVEPYEAAHAQQELDSGQPLCDGRRSQSRQ
jgi:hypothetical protein